MITCFSIMRMLMNSCIKFTSECRRIQVPPEAQACHGKCFDATHLLLETLNERCKHKILPISWDS